MNVLVIDVGGTHVKTLVSGREECREFESGPTMTVEEMVEGVKKSTEGWAFDVISLGYPGPVLRGRPISDPKNLAPGWVGFDFEHAFGCEVKLINDAAMQALGSYRGGRLLFLGLGTGLGSAMIVDGVVEPMELAHLPYRKGTYEDYVGERGLERLGKKRWRHRVEDVVETLASALEPTDVVIGGGNVKKLKELPPNTRAGDNADAFTGGFRLWDGDHAIQTSSIASHGSGKPKESLREEEPADPDGEPPTSEGAADRRLQNSIPSSPSKPRETAES